jgi:putative MATE family efflux protein
LFFFTLPMLFGNVLQTINGSINSIWVGKYLGEAALAATSNAGLLMFLILGGVFGLSMAATILVAQRWGAKDLTDARRVVGTSATFFVGFAALVAVAGIVFLRPLLALLHTPADVIPFAIPYLRITLLALPLSFLYYFVMGVLRGAGDSRTPFRFLLLAVALDVVLNPLFIFGLGPLPRMGIAGSATASLVAAAVSLAAMLGHLYRQRHALWIGRDELHLFRPDWSIVRTLVTKGLPMALQMLVMASSMLAMIGLVNNFGSHVTAAFGAAMQVWNYVQMPSLAVSAAVSSMAAQNVGAGNWSRVGATMRAGIALNFATTGSLVLLLAVVGRPVLSLFLPSDSFALDLASHANRIVLVSYVLSGATMVLFGVVRSTGAVIVPVLLLFVSLWLVRIPVAWALIDRWQEDAIWFSFPVGSTVSLALAILYYRFGNWRAARMGPATR